MRKFNFFCSLVIILSMALFIVTLGQNVTIRTTATYTFYFNDTRVVARVADGYTNSEMSDEIAGFMNSWRPKEFQVKEDTGYDYEDIFDERDSDNMLAVKKAADISFLVCLVSFIISVSIYVYFLKNDFKLVIRKRFRISMAFAVLMLIGEAVLLRTESGIAWLMSFIGLESLSKYSALKILLGGDFINMACNFLIAYTIIICLAVGYATLVLTKPPRIFH